MVADQRQQLLAQADFKGWGRPAEAGWKA